MAIDRPCEVLLHEKRESILQDVEKRRMYSEDYRQCYFIYATANRQIVSKCAIYLEILLSNDVPRQSFLQRHLQTKLSGPQHKPLAFFQDKDSFKKMKISDEEHCRQSLLDGIAEESFCNRLHDCSGKKTTILTKP